QQMMVSNVRSALLLLLGAVGLVLLIACANLANLLLARGTSRAREFALRSTLGAGRWRLVRQLMSETAVLGLVGGVLGVALAYWGVAGLASLLPADLPQVNAIRVDRFVLTFAFVISAAAVCGFGLAPAFFSANSNLEGCLREDGGRSGESAGGRRARNLLAAGELALAMVLVVAGGRRGRRVCEMGLGLPGWWRPPLDRSNMLLH